MSNSELPPLGISYNSSLRSIHQIDSLYVTSKHAEGVEIARMDIKTFHDLCDNKGLTFVLVKVLFIEVNNICGNVDDDVSYDSINNDYVNENCSENCSDSVLSNFTSHFSTIRSTQQYHEKKILPPNIGSTFIMDDYEVFQVINSREEHYVKEMRALVD
ncbi:14931_t:CDS:2 [Funneliformis geosporum]|uniref:14931_t:CDS:1 n=1 Tax=Funneliformis geosporum TaxID=1117311 RepID=A0A9W4SYW3_9GLOM|nr:14931_t:CDS:2 [Funneliformis geosporum]